MIIIVGDNNDGAISKMITIMIKINNKKKRQNKRQTSPPNNTHTHLYIGTEADT